VGIANTTEAKIHDHLTNDQTPAFPRGGSMKLKHEPVLASMGHPLEPLRRSEAIRHTKTSRPITTITKNQLPVLMECSICDIPRHQPKLIAAWQLRAGSRGETVTDKSYGHRIFAVHYPRLYLGGSRFRTGSFYRLSNRMGLLKLSSPTP